jgi:hypothetical protein
MPRKFDKYGWNIQYKYQPVRRKHPFPYELPFCTDFSHKRMSSTSKKTRNDYVTPGPPKIPSAGAIAIPNRGAVAIPNHERVPLPYPKGQSAERIKKDNRRFDEYMFGGIALAGAAALLFFGAPAAAVGVLGAEGADFAGIEMVNEEFWTYRAALREMVRDAKPKMD